MLGYVRLPEDKADKKRKNYRCAECGALITDSSALKPVNGSINHSYVNPAGTQCDFKTFLNCENAFVHDRLYIEHSWFPGFGWRFVLCAVCGQHLGWKFDSTGRSKAAEDFFGLLNHALDEARDDR